MYWHTLDDDNRRARVIDVSLTVLILTDEDGA